MRQLPPLNSLRAFEAAARHLSFTKAAEELHVTPGAISQQIRALEEYCQTLLFQRLTRSLRLTEAGQAALPHLREGFDQLAEATNAMLAENRRGYLTVSVSTSFGAQWLIPRIERFRLRHPEFELRIDANDALVTFTGDGVDVALRYGKGRYPGLAAECLMSEIAMPVCSPKLLTKGRKIESPDDLRHHTLLHARWRMEDDTVPNWRMWLRAAGADAVDAGRGPQFSSDGLVLAAAIEGHGVALLSGALVYHDLRSGRLVRPFPPEICSSTAFGYYLVYPEASADVPKIKAFRDWILDEVARDSSGIEPRREGTAAMA